MSNVKSLNAYRQAHQQEERSVVVCSCGSGWFTPYAVVFEKDGTISGWSGPVVCLECSEPVPTPWMST